MKHILVIQNFLKFVIWYCFSESYISPYMSDNKLLTFVPANNSYLTCSLSCICDCTCVCVIGCVCVLFVQDLFQQALDYSKSASQKIYELLKSFSGITGYLPTRLREGAENAMKQVQNNDVLYLDQTSIWITFVEHSSVWLCDKCELNFWGLVQHSSRKQFIRASLVQYGSVTSVNETEL